MKEKTHHKTWIWLGIITILALLLAFTNYYWYRALKREEETLKNALIPTLSNDYFTNQLALTNQAKIKEDYDYTEWQYYEMYEDPWYQEIIANLYQMGPIDVPLINQNPTGTFTPFLIYYTEAKDIYEWFSYDGKNTYTYPKNSHVIVVTGVDENYYYINDPLKNEKNIQVAKEQLEKSFIP